MGRDVGPESQRGRLNVCDSAASEHTGSDDQRRLNATRQIDALCDEYEQATADGKLVPLQALLNRIDVDFRDRLLQELVGVACERLRDRRHADVLAKLIELDGHLAAELEQAVEAQMQAQQTLSGDGLVLHSERTQLTPRRKKSRGLHLRCPHCSNHVELVGDTPLDAIDCTTCGSKFSLVDRARETRLADTLQQIDRFELVSRLGVGGFGTVWKARDTELERTVAIKIPRHGQLSPGEIEQFLREARSAAQLSHPNIVPVHEVGREGDAVFIVSDLVRGVSLSDQLTSQRPTPREAAQLCATVAAALHHAHERGVVHRDLKPSNVMIDDAGEPHLMDFGLAKREAEEVTMTTDGQIIGTPAYMSPEQAGGRSAWADRRTDIYSLGVMLFELLTGELPFRGNAQMQVHNRLKEDAPSARKVNRHVPVDLAIICAKCLEREPGSRYQTSLEVREELERFLARRPIKARPLSPIQKAVRWSARNPYRAAACGLLALLAVAGPSAALVIESQRSRLAGLLREKDGLIQLKNDEAEKYRAETADLRSQLDVWEGKANPYAIWPPDPAMPPQKRQLASVLRDRGSALAAPTGAEANAESDLTAAQRLLTLSILHESAGHNAEAIRYLQAALPALRRMRGAQPRSLSVAEALLDSYRRLARLTAAANPEVAKEWILATSKLSTELATEFPDNSLRQAEKLDAELRLAVASGFDTAADELKGALAAEKRLTELWPQDVAELYRLVSQLAGVSAPLGEVSSAESSELNSK